jgi:serine/threonine-protein phosphatase 2A regulatory subunit A
MIRRAIALGIGKLSSKMKVDNFVQDMIPLVKVLINDEQDTVRLITLDSIVEISRSLPKELNKSMIIPILIPMIRDRAWKVRIKIAHNFTKLAENMGTDIADNTLLSIFSTLLSDPEGEVRLGAADNFVGLMKFISKSKYPGLIGQLSELLRDSLPLVRVAAYDIFTNIISALPKDEIKQKVIGTFLQNFKTEKDNEVKIMLLKAITCCGIALGAESLAIITNQDINSFLKEKSWRVRKEVYNLIVEVASNSRSNQLFEVHFQEFFLGYLNDPVHQIRIHGSLLLPRILEIEPASWVSNVFIPRIQKLRAQEGSSTYLKRVTAMYSYEKLIAANPQALQSPCVQEILPELKEKVPNVRLVALKVLRAVYKLLDDSTKSTIKSAASGLASDADPDVRSEAGALAKQ